MGEKKPEVPPGTEPNDGMLAMQAQLAELREKVGQLGAALERATSPENGSDARLARVERVACIGVGIMGELYDSSCKSDIRGLVTEAKALVRPLNEAHARAAEEEVRNAA